MGELRHTSETEAEKAAAEATAVCGRTTVESRAGRNAGSQIYQGRQCY